MFVMEIQICFELGPATDQKCVQMIPRSDEIRARHERAKKQNLIPQLLIPDLEDSPRTTADGKSYQPQAILRQPAAPWFVQA